MLWAQSTANGYIRVNPAADGRCTELLEVETGTPFYMTVYIQKGALHLGKLARMGFDHLLESMTVHCI